MRHRFLLALAAATATTHLAAAPLDATMRASLDGYVDRQAPKIASNAHAIWNLAEVGFRETRSSALLQDTLRTAGFTVESGVAGMPTAFTARYRTGPGPVIVILAEFDALPGLSQKAGQYVPTPADGVHASHGCGHNLLGSGAVGGAIAVRQWLQDSGFKGEIRVYGAPAEEGGDGKVYMVHAGLFKDVDVVLHWHPNDFNTVTNTPLQGNIKTDFSFSGMSSHAANAPDKGRSALEGVELMDVAVAFIRQHMPDGSRIHGIVTNGGAAPNVVPDFSQSTYYVRDVDLTTLHSLQDRMLKAAQGAAMATDTKVKWELRGGVYPLLINQTLLPIAYRSLSAEVDKLTWTPEEIAQAAKLQESVGVKTRTTETTVLAPLAPSRLFIGGSSDVGDISYVVPTVGVGIATWPKGVPPHSWASAAASGSSFGTKGAVVAARVLAATAVELMLNPDVVAAAKAELRKSQGDGFHYAPLFGDRAPPLDYADAIMAKLKAGK
jgi:aminobenzoyl-glutamate utilization protein B